jgi:hypothetical protein
MKTVAMLALLGSAVLAGCASLAPPPAGMEAGKFVRFDCDGQDFQARFNPEGNTVRVRTQHGAAELTAGADGVFQGEGFKLMTQGPTGVTIEHAGKVVGKACKRA